MVPKTGRQHRMQPAMMATTKKGVAWPNPRFTDNGNGTVTDNLTGLIWLKNANCFGKELGHGLDGRQHAEQRRMWPDRWFGGRRLAAAQRARDAEPD